MQSCGFLFFQAEDGIRDGHVTGVQTCAPDLFLFPTLIQTAYGGSGACRAAGILSHRCRCLHSIAVDCVAQKHRQYHYLPFFKGFTSPGTHPVLSLAFQAAACVPAPFRASLRGSDRQGDELTATVANRNQRSTANTAKPTIRLRIFSPGSRESPFLSLETGPCNTQAQTPSDTTT